MTFLKTDKELETFLQTKRIYNQDKRIEFGIEKYAMHIMKMGKEK